MIYVFLANGFEEVEALTPVDFLRRCELDVRTVGVSGSAAVGSHRIPVLCDMTVEEMDITKADAVILPGGMPGTLNLEACPQVKDALRWCADNQKWIGAICAAPSVLGHMGLLEGKRPPASPALKTGSPARNLRPNRWCGTGTSSPPAARELPLSLLLR